MGKKSFNSNIYNKFIEMLYITYKKFSILQRAIVNQQRYQQLKNDSSIEDLQLHPSQRDMENFFKECKGQSTDTKQLLYG